MTRLSFFARALFGFAVFLAMSEAAAAAPALEGLWLTDDRKGVVRIARCGILVCGHIVKVLDTGPDVPATDVNNPDPEKRLQPLVGTTVLWGFREGKRAWSGGRAYDPKKGRSYKSTLALNADGSLKVTGCLLIVCRSVRWTRYNR